MCVVSITVHAGVHPVITKAFHVCVEDMKNIVSDHLERSEDELVSNF
ncbi:unnamed protein product, partial [Allacma fusca]